MLERAKQMRTAVLDHLEGGVNIIKAALAVADYHVARTCRSRS